MTSNLTQCWWGPERESFSRDLRVLLGKYADHGAYAGDNLIAFGRNLSFLHDAKFMKAFSSIVVPENQVGMGIMWRLYMFCWAAQSSLRREGAFVECGVSTGTSSAIMCRYLDFESINKKLYLYDAWGTDNRVDGSKYGFNPDTFKDVCARFSPYPNVILVPGFIPNTFEVECPSRIAFLHIDLNNAVAEIAVLDKLFDSVEPGGIILFDDYGATGFKASKTAEDSWLAHRGYVNAIGELPTGQGLLIK